MKKIISIILAVLIVASVFSVVPISVSAAETESVTVGAISGTTGDCTWILDDDGVLTISGKGRMKDYIGLESYAPWSPDNYAAYSLHKIAVKKVIISDGVEHIGVRAFESCSELISVTVPDSVTSISGSAFNNCKNLTSITIPDSVTSIGIGVFLGCLSLESIIVSSGNEVYDSRNNCKAIIETDTNTLIAGCKNTIIPESVTSIGEYAFNRSNLSNITFPDSVTSIGDNAFFYCTALESITIPDSITSIGARSFCGCANLSSITIPDTVTSIGDNAFFMCNNLTIYGYKNSYAQTYANNNNIPFVIITPDTEIPTVFISSTNNIASSQTVTINMYDNVGIKGYYWSKGSYYPNNNSNDYFISTSNSIILKTVDSAGTYFVTAVDTAGNMSSTVSITFYKTVLDPNGGSVSPTSVLTKSGNSFTFPIPTRTNYSCVGWSTSSSATSGVKSLSPTSDSTYYAVWQINKNNISDCAITINPTSYYYDGTAKTPTAIVKDGSKTLTKDTDYTVSYSNNTNVGTATITIAGKGNYTGTTTKTFTITSPKQQFIWGSDNYNFLNSAPTYFPYSTYRNQINSTYANRLKSNLTNSEYQVIFEGTWYSDAWLDEMWGGSCYGMSSTTLLAKEGLLPYSSYQSGATKLYDFGYPKNNSNLLSLITYYQMLQVKDIIQQQYRTVPNKTNKENITNLISLLDKNTTVLVGFQKAGWGGHAILATGYEYGSWTWNGISYQGCIKICDPNASTAYNTRYNIYFNTSSYNWIIPGYSNMTSTAGAKFNYIGADINEINKGGYLSGTSNQNGEGFVARIDAHKISDNRSVSKVVKTNGNYMNQSSLPGEIVEDYSYILGNESEGTIGYNLYDSNAAYKVSQSNAETLQLTMDYGNCLLSGGSLAGTSVIFDKNGYVEANGESAMYNLSATFNEDYPTDWFTVQANGYNANSASLRMVDNGYVLSADNLETVTIKANNREHSAQTKFTTNYKSVFIYEIDENTIGLKVDTDNNGTYETELNTQGDSPVTNDKRIIDGVYYENGVAKNPGLVRIGNNFYCTTSGGKLVYGDQIIYSSRTNGLLPGGVTYHFDEVTGKLYKDNVIIDGVYYKEGAAKNVGIVKVAGAYYVTTTKGVITKDAYNKYIASSRTNGLVAIGYYDFGPDGKMILRNGIIGGKYYVNGKATNVGLFEYEADGVTNIYCTTTGGVIIKDVTNKFIASSRTNGLAKAGYYSFDSEGRMIK